MIRTTASEHRLRGCAACLGFGRSVDAPASEVRSFVRRAARYPLARRVLRSFGDVYSARRKSYTSGRRQKRQPRRREPDLSTVEAATEWGRRNLASGFVLAFDVQRDVEEQSTRAFAFRLAGAPGTTPAEAVGCFSSSVFGWPAVHVPGGVSELDGVRAGANSDCEPGQKKFWIVVRTPPLYMLSPFPSFCGGAYLWGAVVPVPAPGSSPLSRSLLGALRHALLSDLVDIVVEYLLAEALLSHCKWMLYRT